MQLVSVYGIVAKKLMYIYVHVVLHATHIR